MLVAWQEPSACTSELRASVFLELERDGFDQNPFFQCLVAEVSREHQTKEGKDARRDAADV